jgi:alpha-glucosidase
LGLELENGSVLGQNVKISNYSQRKVEDNYRLLTGKTSHVSETCNMLILELAERSSDRRITIEARAYNDGVAFRYVVPEQKSMSDFRLKSEKTEFLMANDPVTYAQVVPDYESGYESEFLKTAGTSTAAHGFQHNCPIALPLLMDVKGVGWVAITEAALENNAGMYLINRRGGSKAALFETLLSPSLDEPQIAVTGKLPYSSAWRTILIADSPNRFIESNLITSLNPECRLEDTSWIEPGKSAWNWWSGSLNKNGDVQFDNENMRYYIDFAAASGIEYLTIDEGWSEKDIARYKPSLNIPELVRYAASKGVKIFIWLRTRDLWDRIDEVFPLYEQWGVSGLKIDFVSRDDQAGIAFYYRVAEKAAKHKLLVDFHGSCKPWGIQRTYPNVVGFEAVIGMEMSKEAGRDNPDNRLTIPYTRMLQGIMDYTPGGFDNVSIEDFYGRFIKPMVMGTRAQHLAMYVVYESPFQMVSDWPENYKNQPAFEFIKKVPVTWDATKALNGYPGEYITVVRKKGDDWYLGSMTGWTGRSFELPLDFLGDGSYLAESYSDTPDSGKNPKQVAIKTVKVSAKSKLKITMAPAGGAAVFFRKL